MKKLSSFVLVLILIMGITIIPALAQNVYDGEYLFENQFVDEYVYGESHEYVYRELYVHRVDEKDAKSDADWVLVEATTQEPMPIVLMGIQNDRYMHTGGEFYPFAFGYAVYDVQADEFISIQNVDFEEYDGLVDALDENKIGVPMGDADGDYRLTILDATFIQRALAKLCEFSYRDEIYVPLDGVLIKHITDFNKDGYRNILDATTIQLKLAQVDEEPVDEIKDLIYVDYGHQHHFYTMPKEVQQLEYESVLKAGIHTPSGYGYGPRNSSCNFVALISSKAQYDEVFNVDNPYYDDEFFKTKSLVVAMAQGIDYYSYCEITSVAVKDNKMYISVVEGIDSPDPEIGLPVAPPVRSYVAVDKELVKDVETIERAMTRFEPKEPYNYMNDRVRFIRGNSSYIPALAKFSQYGVVEIEKVDNFSYILKLDKQDVNNVIEVIKAMQDDEDLCLFYFEPVFNYSG